MQQAQIPQPRLFKAVGARITPQVEWIEVNVKTVLNRVQGMDFHWSINPYRGCEHACHFCFARRTHWFLDQDGAGGGWSSRIFVKVNAPEVLRVELARPTWTKEEVIIGTATDPYQPAEGAYRITRRILEALRDFDTPVGFITRSPMIVRDLDLLQQLARGPGIHVCFSITTVDEKLARELEPAAPPPIRRLEAMRALSNAGISTVVLLAPILPGITDDVAHLTEVVEAAKKHGAGSLHGIALHLGDVTRDAFFNYLKQARPGLIPEYDRLYQRKYAPSQYQQQVQKVVAAIKARVGFTSSTRRSAAERDAPPSKIPSQLQLFSR